MPGGPMPPMTSMGGPMPGQPPMSMGGPMPGGHMPPMTSMGGPMPGQPPMMGGGPGQMGPPGMGGQPGQSMTHSGQIYEHTNTNGQNSNPPLLLCISNQLNEGNAKGAFVTW